MNSDWITFSDWASKAVIGYICLYGVNVLKEMKLSIDDLNKQVTKIIERTDWHTKEIERLETRMSRIEGRNK